MVIWFHVDLLRDQAAIWSESEALLPCPYLEPINHASS